MAVMNGTLAETSMTELLRRLAARAATGRVEVSGPRGTGTLRLHRGDLADARTDAGHARVRLGERLVRAGRLERPDLDGVLSAQSGEAAGATLGQLLVARDLVEPDVVRLFVQEQVLDALAVALDWGDGEFTFTEQEPTDAGVPVSLPVEQALTELRRRDDERDRVRAHVHGPEAVPEPVDEPDRHPRLSADAFTVLSAVDGARSVHDIAEQLGYGVDEVSRVVFRLVLQGLVTVADTVEEDSPVEENDSVMTSGPATASSTIVDEGWARRRTEDSPVDEPEPWVGWAHGAEDAPAAEQPADEPVAFDAPGEGRQPPGPADTSRPEPPPATPEPAPPAASSWDAVDEATRQSLYSELHAVGHEATGGASPPTREPEAEPQPEPTEPEPEPEPEVAQPRWTTPTSRPSDEDVSELLRELHALNLDDD